MALNAEIRDQAYQFFCQEAPEFLHAIETGLLTLKQDQSTANIHQIMRAAHSIKGGAASVELEGIKEIAHKLEDVFRALYHWDQGIDRDMEELMLLAFDTLRVPLLEQIATGSYDIEQALDKAQTVFETLEALLGDSLLNLDSALPTASELGIDIAQVVFAGDVQQGIDRLNAILNDPQAEVLGEFRAQSEVFAGIGELLNLPGFTEIARSVITALNSHPEGIAEIAPIALENFRAAQAQVLGGDRELGGTLSPELSPWIRVPELSWDYSAEPLFMTTETDDFFPIDRFIEEPVAESILQFPEFSEDLFPIDRFTDEEDDSPSFSLLDQDQTLIQTFEDSANEEYSNWLEETISSPIVSEEEDIISDMSGWLTEDFVDLVNQEKEKQNNPETIIQAVVTDKKKRKPQKQIPAPQMTEVIRVDLQRLERLNNLVGELVTQENGSELQVQQLQNSIKQLQERFTLFERLNRNLQTWLDQSQKIQVRNALQSAHSEFDPLQMDYYSPLYTMIQESIEEIAQMGEKVQDITLVAQQSKNIQRKKQQTLKQLRNDLLWARMIPLGDILNRFPRMVRDLSLKYQKNVNAKVVGANTLVDKQMLEKLYDPLVHLVRNAFDHGIEGGRVAQGKPEAGTIEIRAYHRGNQTFIEVQDDGRGIDPQRILEKAIERNLVKPEAARNLSQAEIYEFLFAPDFSTADKVTDLSGRGMGMGAVLSQVQALKGSITIDSEVGKGTLFTLRLPLTLTISKLLVVRVGGRLLAVPVDSLAAVMSIQRSEIETVWEKDFYRYDRILVPIYPSGLFANHYPLPLTTKQQVGMELPEDSIPLLLMSLGNRMVALVADQVVTEQELVIKPFNPIVAAPPYLYGCTILGDGSLLPVIDAAALISRWLSDQPTPPSFSPEVPSFAMTRVLVVDDSLTARQTLALTLSRSGYEVIQAGDGREALEKLKENPIDAVFCDVEMPVMNGFEFLTNCRQEYPPDRLPVIMLTSRSGERHRGIAKLLGASGYLTKPFLEGDLLQTLENCLQPALV